MDNKELLDAIRQLIHEETTKIVSEQLMPVRTDINTMKSDISGIKVVMDTEMSRDIKLLAEGHEEILERLPDPENFDALEARVSAVEAVIKLHSKDIQKLKKA